MTGIFGRIAFLVASILMCTSCLRQESPLSCSCTSGNAVYAFNVTEGRDRANHLNGYRVSCMDTFRFQDRRMPFEVRKVLCGDLGGSNQPEIMVQAFKTTPYDSVKRKRPFIFQLENDRIIPLWMGSRLPHPLHDFRMVPDNDKNRVRTMEFEADNNYLVAEYQLGSFGLEFVRYLGRDLKLTQAEKLFSE